MWLNEHIEAKPEYVEPEREVVELETKLTDMIQKSLHGNFAGQYTDIEKENSKVMFTGAIIGIMMAVYFGKSPLFLGVTGALIARVLSNKE
tara:strand:+ start:360 stop:632 length:273 start_codon:yes stop_codon:yes gene_type:complete